LERLEKRMREEDIKKYEGLKVSIVLKNGFRYSGKVEEVREDCIFFIDKFGNNLMIAFDELSVITDYPEKKGVE
jgi:sRNA-binding regulator protein Hfq